jgi:serine/threonine-protein phosphatase 2B catalytic subunit
MQYNKSNKKNVLTIFSAPNYCDKYNNLGSVAIIEKQDIKLDTFKHVEHPYVLPNNMNIFEWSVGIISRQAVKILV